MDDISPIVSIIIPCYNYATLIHETLTCVLEQSYTNWEAIIVDDGSTDNTKAIVEAFTSDLRFIYIFQKNKGLPAARNTGLAKAKGKYIQFLDADDLISKEKLRLQVHYMEEHANVHISYTNAVYFKHGNVDETYATMEMTHTPWIPKLHSKGIKVVQELIARNIMPVNAPLIRYHIFEIVGQQNENLKSLEDWEFWFRCALCNFFFSYIENPKAFALIRVHPNSMSINKIRMINQELVLRENMKELVMTNSGLLDNNSKSILKNSIENKKIRTYRSLLIAQGFFNISTIKEIYSKHGLYNLLKIYIKALNDFRKQKRKH